MPNITSNSAPIYSADLLYEQNCKCGTTVVLADGESWTSGSEGKAWKVVILAATTFAAIEATNISAQDLVKLQGHSWTAGQELMLNFTDFEVVTGLVVVYMDCLQS